jgi:SAM-dependent methyltransferase
LYTGKAEELRARGEPVSEFQHIPVFADGREAPFKDETFDYVLLSSVISDPGIEASDAAQLIEEALRLVKNDGMVILGDLLTPFVTEDRFLMTNGETDDVFHVIGLDEGELSRQARKASAIVDKSLPSDIRILKKSANFGKVDLKMYDR